MPCYLDEASAGRFQSYLGEDATYNVSGNAPIAKASAMPHAVAMAEMRIKQSTPRENAKRYNQVVAFIKTLPANKQRFIKKVAQRYASVGVSLSGYSDQANNGLADWASALTAAAGIYMGYEGMQAQKDAQKAADTRAAAQARRDADYQKAQLAMAQQSQAFSQQQIMQQTGPQKAGMSTGTKLAIGAGVVAAGTVAVMAMN